jgi:hypothetical protein
MTELHGFIKVEGNRKYYVTFRKKEHVYKIWNSYGISYSILKELVKQLVDFIVIRTPEGEYIAGLWDFLNSPYETHYQGDIQKHLPLSNFTYRPKQHVGVEM